MLKKNQILVLTFPSHENYLGGNTTFNTLVISPFKKSNTLLLLFLDFSMLDVT